MEKCRTPSHKARTERNIMSKSRTDWVTKLKFAFQDATKLYLVMEYMPGGDLRTLLDRFDVQAF